MLSWSANQPVYLCVQPIDLRKSFEGLSALVVNVFGQNLFDGHLFLFVNKRRDRIKALWWERDGISIFYKRLEKGCFEIPRDTHGRTHVTLDATALAMLLGGVPLSTPRRKRYARAS